MWQRFTERARRVVCFAQEEAARLGENYVGTEHLLVGLIREGDGLGARVLIKNDADLERVRREVFRMQEEHQAHCEDSGAVSCHPERSSPEVAAARLEALLRQVSQPSSGTIHTRRVAREA